MTNDFKKGFLTGAGGLLGVLSIPLGVYILYLLYIPTIMSLQKKEYLNWVDCYWSNANYDKSFKYLKNKGKEFNAENIKAYKTKICGEKPKRWKWQFSNKWLICME